MATAPTTAPRARPLSPHLSIWRWSSAMLVSILHRATGSGMATVGTLVLVWWLAALASGPESYGYFLSWFTGPWGWLGYILGIGLTLSLFQHLATGVRHLVMDTGALFELRANKAAAVLTMVFSVLATILFWLWLGIK